MIYRGSLRQCITYLGTAYKVTALPRLAIIQRARGKYYCILTDTQLAGITDAEMEADVRLIFRGTIRELTTFTTAIPVSGDLFDDTVGGENAHSTEKDL